MESAKVTVKLIDALAVGDSLVPVEVYMTPRGIDVTPEGHSCANGGSPVYIEQIDGVVRVVIWADINQEDPTHTIELTGARECMRGKHE